MSISRELLMAYADDELDAGARAQVERAIAEDPSLAHEVERYRRRRSEVAAVYAGLLELPVPAPLVARIREAEIARPPDRSASLVAARQLLPAPAWERAVWQAVPLAASLALGFVLGAALMGLSAPSGAVIAEAGGRSARGALAAALTERLSADPMKEDLAVGLSFRDREGAYCRAFVVRDGPGLSGVACREEDAWRVRMTVADAPAAADGGLRQAGTAFPRPVLTAIEDVIEGDPLDAEGEAAARSRGWRD